MLTLPFGLARYISYKGRKEASPAVTGWLSPSLPPPFPFKMTSIKMTNIQHTILKTHDEHFQHVQAITIFQCAVAFERSCSFFPHIAVSVPLLLADLRQTMTF
jgi:hypothetical protein